MSGTQPVCHEEITRRGELQPCGRLAIGYRIDQESGEPYPVCVYHHRPPYPDDGTTP